VLLACGRRDEARHAAETSLRLHEAKQNAVSAAEMREFLGVLGS
jgi:hypothetical protein